MNGNQGLGFALLLLGLVVFITAILGKTGATLAALIYGPGVLKEGGK